jgi:hypothetical protein
LASSPNALRSEAHCKAVWLSAEECRNAAFKLLRSDSASAAFVENFVDTAATSLLSFMSFLARVVISAGFMFSGRLPGGMVSSSGVLL